MSGNNVLWLVEEPLMGKARWKILVNNFENSVNIRHSPTIPAVTLLGFLLTWLLMHAEMKWLLKYFCCLQGWQLETFRFNLDCQLPVVSGPQK